MAFQSPWWLVEILRRSGKLQIPRKVCKKTQESVAEDPEKTLPEVQVLLESDSKDNGRHMAETNHPTSVAGTKVC